MPPEETEEPQADSPTTPATVEPTGDETPREVVQDQTITETHVEERPSSEDEDVNDDEDGDSEEE